MALCGKSSLIYVCTKYFKLWVFEQWKVDVCRCQISADAGADAASNILFLYLYIFKT